MFCCVLAFARRVVCCLGHNVTNIFRREVRQAQTMLHPTEYTFVGRCILNIYPTLLTSLVHNNNIHDNLYRAPDYQNMLFYYTDATISELTYFAEKFGRPKPSYSLPNAPLQTDMCQTHYTVTANISIHKNILTELLATKLCYFTTRMLLSMALTFCREVR